ncbi:hypothetical protein PG630_09055 [Riemerella anatipestifer]|nr:hypothetical protein [Riemerella anatipestifer]
MSDLRIDEAVKTPSSSLHTKKQGGKLRQKEQKKLFLYVTN